MRLSSAVYNALLALLLVAFLHPAAFAEQNRIATGNSTEINRNAFQAAPTPAPPTPSNPDTGASFLTDVTPEEALRLINEASEQDKLIILDIRTTPEFLIGHIANAQHINFYDSDFTERLNALPKDMRYLIYCHSGSRSERALTIMRKLGFQKIYHLQTGIAGWYKANLPLER
ncbi:rhodanese-like domain-containing protein [Desulfovibrio subterraneus]|uniref:rhodanese-like domain-containing protein n=1 Tax=Desulfovibrio subterraneus TaxID=2718620 RepID=UPI0022B902E3|nr:rhodanese-like domain-containing protein [Desulfovibrio subterraneus]WBF68879.1 rhodanese-like domain-containing protein [Desulfovibrio subterraneus]